MTMLRRYDEWRVSTSYSNGEQDIQREEGSLEDLPEGLEWQRWDCHDDDTRVRLTPALPQYPRSEVGREAPLRPRPYLYREFRSNSEVPTPHIQAHTPYRDFFSGKVVCKKRCVKIQTMRLN